jgi:hypothetical protein
VNVNYEQQKIRCGKARCRCNTSDQSQWHGPYWYAFWTDEKTGKKRSRYVGKHFSPPQGPARPRAHSEWRPPPPPPDERAREEQHERAREHHREEHAAPPPRRSRFETAAEVLGVSVTAPQAEVKKAWRKLAIENHPDKFRGAEKAEREQRAKTINAAWDTYRAARGWT